MTAAAALSHPGSLCGGAARLPQPPHLHLVPGRAGSDASAESLQSAGRRPRSGTVHLTRRGRLAMTLSMLAVLALLPVILLSLVVPADAGGEVTVRPGQTLSELAATHLPEVPHDVAIVQIQRANGLSSSQLQAGQVLQLPNP